MKRLIVVVIVALSTGCSGLEVGGKLGVYGIDTREEVQRTASKAKPMICWWKQCDDNGNVIQGS